MYLISVLLIANLWASDISPAERAALTCLQNEVDLYEARKGRLPTDDEADLIIDACMEKYNHVKKEIKN